MARRAEDKAQLRAERIAREQADAVSKLRRQRLRMAAGVVVLAAVIAAVAIAVGAHHGTAPDSNDGHRRNSAVTRQTDTRVEALLRGIPQPSDNVLGRADAPVSVIEYGDLECSVCDAFALSSRVDTSDGTPGSGVEDQIIDNLVRTGKVNLVYRSLETETIHGATPGEWLPQQVAAYAAGMQDRGWNYIELFYNEQGAEGSDYVGDPYLDGIAKQIPGLNYAQWQADLSSAALKSQVNQENRQGIQTDDQADQNQGASTPTVMVSGPRGQRIVSLGIPTYAEVLSAVSSVR